MTQFRSVQCRLRYHRGVLASLLLCMMIGSLFGAISVHFSEWSISAASQPGSGSDPIVFSLPRIFAFPGLMAVAMLLRRPKLLYLLFFCKGFVAAYVLCVCAMSGAAALNAYLPCFLLEILFPLPSFLLLGAVWYDDARMGKPDAFPAILLLPASAGLLLERLIFL